MTSLILGIYIDSYRLVIIDHGFLYEKEEGERWTL
jgi:hypothetical protein